MVPNLMKRWCAGLAALTLAVVGCGDDANDGAIQQRRAEQLAAEARADATEAAAADDEGTAPAPEAAASTTIPPTGVVVTVVAIDNTFRPSVVEISVGDEVLWENRGMNEHDVLHVDGDDWGVEVADFQPGDVYLHQFSEPGEYRYYCSIHGTETVGMVGTVIVHPA